MECQEVNFRVLVKFKKKSLKSVSIFNITAAEFSLFLPLSFWPCSCIYDGWYYGCYMFIHQKICLIPSIQIRKKRTGVERERMSKKKRLFYDSQKLLEKDFCRASLFFYFLFFFFLRNSFHRFHKLWVFRYSAFKINSH